MWMISAARSPKRWIPDLQGVAMEQDLQAADVHPGDLRARQMFELGAAHFIRHLHRRQFLLGFADGLISGMV